MPDLDIKTQLDFAVVGKTLRSAAITELLGIAPTTAFEIGDEYIGKQKTAQGIESVRRTRPTGVWHFCTADAVEDSSVMEHAKFLLEKLEPASRQIRQLCKSPDYFLKIAVWYVGPGGFGMDASILRRLAALCEEVTITCWESDDDVPTNDN